MERISITVPTTQSPGPAASHPAANRPASNRGNVNWERWAVRYARLALGTAFLSAVASRFGLWDKTVDLKHFANFIQYAAQVLSFVPAAIVPLLAWAATAFETTLGILLILGLWTKWVSLASATLLAMFGTAMAISFGAQSPMDYSVFSASSAAALLALYAWRQDAKQSSMPGMEGKSS
ncbi:MAG: MauE/DoxX family redox-associated membrane protein [Terracidiphilus sp.]